MNNNEEFSKTKWACRRGMLELDLLLQDFVEHVYLTLPRAQQITFQRLLETSDPELFAYLMGKETASDSELIAIIDKIRQHAKSKY